ncbi:MAG: hypothetical protein FWD14_04450 [Treponema sp.]|nr:hypothetical protein [Treponema sp.]
MLKNLIEKGEVFKNFKFSADFLPDYIDNPDYQNWKRGALMFLQVNYPKNSQTEDFNALRDSDKFHDYETMMAILRAFEEFSS